MTTLKYVLAFLNIAAYTAATVKVFFVGGDISNLALSSLIVGIWLIYDAAN